MYCYHPHSTDKASEAQSQDRTTRKALTMPIYPVHISACTASPAKPHPIPSLQLRRLTFREAAIWLQSTLTSPFSEAARSLPAAASPAVMGRASGRQTGPARLGHWCWQRRQLPHRREVGVHQLRHFKNREGNPSPASLRCSGIEISGNLMYVPFLSSPMLRTGRCKRLEQKNVGAVGDICAYDMSPCHSVPPRPHGELRGKARIPTTLAVREGRMPALWPKTLGLHQVWPPTSRAALGKSLKSLSASVSIFHL